MVYDRNPILNSKLQYNYLSRYVFKHQAEVSIFRLNKTVIHAEGQNRRTRPRCKTPGGGTLDIQLFDWWKGNLRFFPLILVESECSRTRI